MSGGLISWILSLLVIVVVASGFFIGFWRGLKRSTASLIISIVGLIVGFFITPPIAKAILNIPIAVNGTTDALQNVIANYLMSIEEVGSLIEKNPNLEAFFVNLPTAIANVVVLIVVSLILQGIMYVIYKVLAMTVLKKGTEEKKRRLSGGIVGAVKSFVILLFIFMPFSSLIGVANACTNAGDYGINPPVQTHITENDDTSLSISLKSQEEGGQENENSGGENAGENTQTGLIPENIKSIIGGFENNLLTKMCGLFGLDNALFDYYGNFELNGEKIVVRKEILNVYNVVDVASQLANVDETYSFKDFNYKKITETLNNLTQSPMFENILADTLGEIIINYKDYPFIANSKFAQDNAQILDALSLGLKVYTEAGGSVSDYFTEDLNKLIGVASSLGQSGIIDDIVSLEPINLENAIIVLTDDKYYETTKINLETLFGMNLVRDGAEEIIKTFAQKLSTQLDPIGVSTENWGDNEWNDFANSIASVCKRYADISRKVDVFEVVEDPTILLDKNKNYNISEILSSLGLLIDEIRDVNLLKTSENKPIVDKLLSSYNIPLPNEDGILAKVESGNTQKDLSSYKQLFEFISPSLVTLRDKDVYQTIMTEGDINTKLISLADILSQEGNGELLSEILLPLYQVEPTKTLILSKVSSGLESDLIDFSSLSTYQDWKSDLKYISNLLITLNSKKVGDETYLTLALNDKFDQMIDNLSEDEIDQIIKPAFYAKSTNGIKQKVVNKIKTDLILFTFDENLEFSTANITFVEGEGEDQTQEICEVLKKLLPLKSAYLQALGNLKNVDKSLLGEMLTTMQKNAYRKTLASKTEDGIFKSAFISLMTKFKSSYQTEISALESQPDELEKNVGVRNLNEENYSKIDFEALMSALEQLQS